MCLSPGAVDTAPVASLAIGDQLLLAQPYPPVPTHLFPLLILMAMLAELVAILMQTLTQILLLGEQTATDKTSATLLLQTMGGQDHVWICRQMPFVGRLLQAHSVCQALNSIS
jgi:hypothetical protein